jgi:elongation factor G
MPRRPIDTIRNLGIIAHIDAGKTTTTERFLFYAGETHKLGEVHDGQAVMDFREDERERGITISSAATTFYWRDCEINLIDTPGHVDFVAEVERSLRVLDGAVVIFDAAEGVEPQSESVWRQADRYGVPRLCFLNKMDKVGADFEASVASIRQRLGATPLPIQIPYGAAQTFAGVIDLVEERLLVFDPAAKGTKVESRPIPAEARPAATAARSALVEMLSDFSDPLAERFLAGDPISPEELRPVLRRATLERHCVPVLCGSALRNTGIQPLLDGVCWYLPSPADLPPAEGIEPKSRVSKRRYPRDTDPFSALVFKITTEVSADLHYARVYSGRAATGDAVLDPRTGRKERLHRILRMHADRGVPQETAEAGEIVAFTGPKEAATGDTLCDPAHPIEYEPIRFPDTVVTVAVEPRNAEERDRLVDVLRRMEREDPTFHQQIDPETGQTILAGMGELHLEVLRHRMEREFKLHVHFGRPRVSYRETLEAPAESLARFERTYSGHVLAAEVSLALSPEPATHGVRVTHTLTEGAIPAGCVPGVLATIRGSAEGGGAYGFPLTGVHAVVRSARLIEGNDPAAALNAAAARALLQALATAKIAVLEPIMSFEVRVPEEYLGGVLKHLHAKRAEIRESQIQRAQATVLGTVPLAEMFGFSTTLRSLTQGRASFTMEPLDHRPIPEAQAALFDRRRLV